MKNTIITLLLSSILAVPVTSVAKETKTIIVPKHMLIDQSKGLSQLGAITAVKENYKGDIVSVIKKKDGWMIRFIDRTGAFLFIGVHAER